MTGLDVVSASLRLIGAIAPGETPAAQEATDGLAALNRMISGWSNESLMTYAEYREVFSLTANKATYTMGVGGDFATSRPQRVLEVMVRDDNVTPAVEYPVRLLSLDEYSMIRVKDITSVYPNAIFDDENYPLRGLSLYPKPSVANKLVITSLKPITEIATLTTSVVLPPGYEEALIYNFAIRIAPEYGRTVSQEVVLVATESKASIKRNNHTPEYLRSDEGLLKRSGTFNIYTGGSR